MIVTWQSIIVAGSVLSAILLIGGVALKIVSWFLKQERNKKDIVDLREQHAEDVKHINEENRLICQALSACLDGLIQLGANHDVPKAKAKLDEYLNMQAHK